MAVLHDASKKDSSERRAQGGNPEITRLEAVRCPLCGVEPVEFGVDYQGFHLSRCPQCGLELESPRRSFPELAEKVYTPLYHDEIDLGEPEAERDAEYQRQLRAIEQIAGGRGTLLDVGCGTGEFLRFALAQGWLAAGTDITLEPAARASVESLYAGQLCEIDFGARRFDAVRFHHVLEHVQNPLADLKRARGLLRTGGALFVSVPNMAGISARLKSLESRLGWKSRPYRHYSAWHHLWYFAPKTLGRLLDAAGFEVARWETRVGARHARPAPATAVLRAVLQPLKIGAILDFYCRAR